MRTTGSLAALLAIASISGFAAASRAADSPKPSPLGKQIGSFKLADFRGKEFSLDELKQSQAVVVAFIGVECPLVAHYAARLQELASKYESKGVAFVAIDSNQQDSLTELAAFARKHQLEIPVLKDPGNQVADAFGAERTPEVFVLDRERRVVYHGRIDDQFTYGKQRSKAEQAYLTTALDQLLAGQKIETPHAEPVGCHIGRVLTPKTDSDVTYSQQIARIFQNHCVSCHRPGEIGPFALTSYEDVVGWAGMIDEVVQEQRMPPWHANPAHGKFANDARLSDDEKDQIKRWVAAGAPEGDKKDLPPPREFTVGWQIGEPDAVVYMSETPYNVPATGEVRYQYFTVDPGFQEDKWIQFAECRPGNRAVVHHIIVGVIPPRSGGRLSGEDLSSNWLAATAPGARPLMLPDGMAKHVPAGSKLVFQLHYTPNGTAQQDRSSVGFKFADAKSVKKVIGTDKAANPRFQIPAGDSNYKVEAYTRFDRDMQMLAMFPHMHLRGKAFRYTAIYPDNRREILLDVPHYDFGWQNSYEFLEPKLMPKGTRLYCEAWFDNSEENLANPDPTATVRWGDQTWEEMMIGYFDATPADPDLTRAPEGEIGPRTAQFLALARDGKAKPSDDLKALATVALKSQSDLERFSPQLRQIVPQLDRLCWTALEDDKLHVRRCVQDSELNNTVGGAGRKVDVRITRLSSYATKTELIVHQDLAIERAIDLQLMARAFKSSAHFPVEIDGLKGSLNFWSAEKAAFPLETVELLKEVVKAMAK